MIQRLRACTILLSFGLLPGCHSAYVQVTLHNSGPTPINLVEVSYPDASFGVQAIPPGSDFSYRFKIQGQGPVTLKFRDAGGGQHQSSGPTLEQGQQGTLMVTIGPADKIKWLPSLISPQK